MTEVANAMEDLEQKRSSRPDNWKESVKEQGERCSKLLKNRVCVVCLEGGGGSIGGRSVGAGRPRV